MKKNDNFCFLRLCFGSILLLQIGGCLDLLHAVPGVEEVFTPASMYSYPVFAECEYLIDWTWYYGACGLVH